MTLLMVVVPFIICLVLLHMFGLLSRFILLSLESDSVSVDE